MFVFVLGLIWCLAINVSSEIPPSNICYQHSIIQNACSYGNLTVAVLGKTFKPKDCNSHIDVKTIEQAPFIYINSTNSSERFTVLIQDLGPQGLGPIYLQWMVTNVSINTLPDYPRSIPPNNILRAYEKPLFMHGSPQPHLVQVLVFRHWNTLRAPFSELWVTRKQNFQISTLFSNTSPHLRLCGPVAGTQYWVHDDSGSSYIPSAPLPPRPPGSPVFVPVVPVVPVGQPGYVPVGSAPVGQTGFVPVGSAQGHPGYVPIGAAPVQPGYGVPQQPVYNYHPQQPTYGNQHSKKNSAVKSEPLSLLFVAFTIFFLYL